jgi:phosphopantothenoylcysteine decarboxylase / phosphopantothenate---cysteine ligase
VLALLASAGAVVGAPGEHAREISADGKHVVLALSGGMAAAYAPAVTELLIAQGLQVRIAATPAALRFVRRMPLEALTHHPVAARPWPHDPREPVPHLALSSWADVVVVYPATATTLSRIARGDCSTVVSAIAISARCPVILVPAMNEAMFDAPSIQRNLAGLREDGFILMHPSLGYEVAQEPTQRRPAFGAAPVLQAVVEVTVEVLRGPAAC